MPLEPHGVAQIFAVEGAGLDEEAVLLTVEEGVDDGRLILLAKPSFDPRGRVGRLQRRVQDGTVESLQTGKADDSR